MGAAAVRTVGAGRVVYAALTVRRTVAIRIRSRLRGFLTLHLVSSVDVRDVAKLPSGRGFWFRKPGWNFPFIVLVRYERVFGGPAATFLAERCGRTRGLVGDLLGPF
jgi:hypothetical protein